MKSNKNIKTLAKDISQDMNRIKTNKEIYLNIFILLVYTTLFGLSVYCSYRCYTDLYYNFLSDDSGSDLNKKLINIAQSVSLFLTAYLILLSLFLGLTLISIIRWFNNVFGKGEHIAFFAFNVSILILSFIILVTFSVFYSVSDFANITNKTTIYCFYTSLFTFIFALTFVLFYVIKPKFLMH